MAALGDVHVGQHLEPADDRAVQRLGQLAQRFELAVDAELHEDDLFFGIDVDVRGAALKGDFQELVAEGDDVRRLGGGAAASPTPSSAPAGFLAAQAADRATRAISGWRSRIVGLGSGRLGNAVRQLQARNVGGDNPLIRFDVAHAMGRHQVAGGRPLLQLFQRKRPVGLAVADFEVPLVAHGDRGGSVGWSVAN